MAVTTIGLPTPSCWRGNHPGSQVLSGYPLIPMMHAATGRKGNQLARPIELLGLIAGNGRISGQPLMWTSNFIILFDVFSEQFFQMPLVENDDVVQQFSA